MIIGDGIGGGVYALDATTGRQRWRVSSGAVRGLATAGGVVPRMFGEQDRLGD